MQTQTAKPAQSYAEALASLEELNRRVWGDKIVLATTAHTLGGIGLGLLLTQPERYRGLATALLGFSSLAHLYAIWTMRPAGQAATKTSGA
ncbi:MAG: hypothetical protein HY689_06160 [Chloroflexi bacterium]|nr:hypothetical protein [Chloroflexota bacterium]